MVEGSSEGLDEDCQRAFSASRAAIRPLSWEPMCGEVVSDGEAKPAQTEWGPT